MNSMWEYEYMKMITNMAVIFNKKITNFAIFVIIFIYSYFFIMAHSTIQYIKSLWEVYCCPEGALK